MKNLEFVKYETPEVEIIEVEVERGFATSGGGDGNGETGDVNTGA